MKVNLDLYIRSDEQKYIKNILKNLEIKYNNKNLLVDIKDYDNSVYLSMSTTVSKILKNKVELLILETFDGRIFKSLIENNFNFYPIVENNTITIYSFKSSNIVKLNLSSLRKNKIKKII